MRMSNREMILGMATLAAILFGFTYWMAGSKIAEQREMSKEKVRLRRQIQLHKRILEEQSTWIDRLDELQAQLPVYGRKVSVNVELPPRISEVAREHGLEILQIRPTGEKQIGSLYELSVQCDFQGDLEALVHFLYDLHSQGLRFDIQQIGVKPVAKQEGQLKGSMIINCAYRRTEPGNR